MCSNNRTCPRHNLPDERALFIRAVNQATSHHSTRTRHQVHLRNLQALVLISFAQGALPIYDEHPVHVLKFKYRCLLHLN